MLMLEEPARSKVIAALAVEYSLEELEHLGAEMQRAFLLRLEVESIFAHLSERVDWDELGMVLMLVRRDYHREYYQWRAALRPKKHAEELSKRNEKRRDDYAVMPTSEREVFLTKKRARDNRHYHAQPLEVRKQRKKEEHAKARSDPSKLARIREQQRAAQARYRARVQARAAE